MRKLKLLGKKTLAFTLVSALTLSLAACGCSKDEESEETTTNAANQTTAEKETEAEEPEIDRPAANSVTAYDAVNTDYKLSIDALDEVHDISDLLFGIFIEDINFAADGGLYAEKIANRSFEFTTIAKDDEMYRWNTVGTVDASVTVDDLAGALNENNTNYLVMTNTSGAPAGVENGGFLDGISVEENANYNISLYLKGLDGYTGPVTVNIAAGDDILATGTVESITANWAKYTMKLTSSKTLNSGVKLQVLINDGKVAADMISMFPEDTYKGRENGLRKDLATMLEELQPSFLRFPGGCVIEGYDYDTAYNWKDSIGVGKDGKPLFFNNTYGDVAAREQGINIWTDVKATNDPWPSFMTYGLGFFEYFQLAEDIGAVGVPVLNCGLYCQARGKDPVPMDSDLFKQYIQDALDLVEFCKGDVNTTWGKVRAALGHPEPFELKYIGIGNENYTNTYYERYSAFVEAFEAAKQANPALYEGVELIYSAGLDDGDSGGDYIKAYQYAEKYVESNEGMTAEQFAGAIDHHYYNDPSWFLKHTNYYDEINYSRDAFADTVYGGKINVFLGEYAAKSNKLEAALAEAAYMTGIERNGDIIRMAAYAPLFGNLTATHWAPDLIWFNNHQCTGSISYYMQKLFANNAGSKLLGTEFSGAEYEMDELKGLVGVGTWNTSAKFDNVKVVNNDTGEVLGEQVFDGKYDYDRYWFNWGDGDFRIKDGELYQNSTSTDNQTIGSVSYYGYTDWENYTYTVEATKISGDEGFLIPFAAVDKDNNFFWNIGGWGNTVSCLQQVSDGSKSDKLSGTTKDINIIEGKTYELKVVVKGNNIKCYIDDELYVDYIATAGSEAEAYQVVSTDESGDIIVKIVNVTGSDRVVAIDLKGIENVASQAKVYQVAGTSLNNDNILGQTEACKLEEFVVDGVPNKFNYTIPKYSATVIRLSR